jgi:hypothetical protein
VAQLEFAAQQERQEQQLLVAVEQVVEAEQPAV